MPMANASLPIFEEAMKSKEEQTPETSVSKGQDPDKDLILISRGIDFPLFFSLNHAIKERKKKCNNSDCVLFLTTQGGDPDAGYRIAKCLQNSYETIRLVVSSYCKSAGTLIAIAANEIAFGDLGELGPLDVQVMKHDEFGAQASGLDIIEAMEAISNHMRKCFAQNLVDIRFGTKISTRLAGDLAAQLTASIAAPLYAQIDPQRVAEMQRAMSIALNYGERLVRKSQSLKKDALKRLVSSYPTHSFVIDKDEASELFSQVSCWTPEEERFYEKFQTVLAQQRTAADGGPFVESFNAWMKTNDANQSSQPEGNTKEQTPEGAGRAPKEPSEKNRS